MPKKILIVDDDCQFGQMLVTALAQIGILADFANNSTQAMSFAKNNIYQLILQDVYLPTKEVSFKLLPKYRKIYQQNNVPIVMMTSMPLDLFAQENALDEYLTYTKEFISKGEDLKNIVAKIKEIVSTKKG